MIFLSPHSLRKIPGISLRSRCSQRGMALVLVLGVLVLFTGLALAIFLTATTERRTSSLFAGSVEARQLADTSINLCMAQIRDATSATNRAWVSQPGLIRTYTGNRQPDTNYRLYSWTDMRPAGAFDPFSPANAVPSGWKTKKAAFVDINEPAPDPASPADTTRDKYPVFYPPSMTGNGTAPLAGYSVNAVSGVATSNEVPMPVKWLYVLKDGSVKEASEESDTTVRVSSATDANPIVGRIAFWSDDESSKVNLNTAAGGMPWMPPWIQSRLEYSYFGGVTYPVTTVTKDWGDVYGFGFSQPMKNEFQRYPGHPATTDLQAVFPELSWRDIYKVVPRVIAGGSENGIKRTRKNLVDNQPAIDQVNDRDRLFAGLGEARFQARKDSASDARSSFVPAFQDANLSDTKWDDLLEKRKAFLTVSSKAPELNLFGQPRVAIWPIPLLDTAPAGKPFRTAADKLIAFCSTLVDQSASPAVKYPFYFDRQSGQFTATSGVPVTTSLSKDADITRTRNTQVYRYLQRLTSSPFPGVSGVALSSKPGYGGDRGRDQILTENFDYIRSTNIEDRQLASVRRFNDWSYVRPTRWNPGSGETTGFGRGLSIRQAGLFFICNADATVTASNIALGDPAAVLPLKANQALEEFPAGKLVGNQRRIQALFVLEFFCPAAGFKSFTLYNFLNNADNATLSFRVRGLENLKVNGINLGFPDGVTCNPSPIGHLMGGADATSYTGAFGIYGGAINYRWPLWGRDARDITVGGHIFGASATNVYPYVSVPITVTLTAPLDPTRLEMSVSGANLTVEIFSGLNGTASSFTPKTLIETIPLNLDPVSLPAPRLHPTKQFYWAFNLKGIFGDSSPVGRFNRSTTQFLMNAGSSENNVSGVYTADALIADKRTGPATWDGPYDVVQTYILPHGDYRTLFAPTGSPNQSYIPVPDPNIGTNPTTAPLALNPSLPQFRNLRHFLSDATISGGLFGYSTGTSYAPDAARRWTGQLIPPMLRKADYPASLNAPWTFGDWDTGSPWGVTDGPLINKPDEGSTEDTSAVDGNGNPYASTTLEGEKDDSASIYHSPNRQVPSAVMFGSLPTGLISGQPWQTLLFRPDPGGHPGAKDPADHLLLDLFWMPIVEPYAISEPFSTAGKVNMNYQIIPFTYIERSTAVRAVLKGTQIGAIDETCSRGYQKNFLPTPAWPINFSYDINIPETLTAFADKFTNKEVFLTPSEITTMRLVPTGETYDSTPAFWNRNRFTGENIKERPYATIYPRLTTKSNVFNVHYRVQTLRKRPGSDAKIWDEGKDAVVAQLRGNAIIERFLDMNRSAGIPDYALPANANKNAETLYRFRILSNQEFNP